MSILDTAIGWVAPPECVVCQTEGHALCPSCATDQIIPYGETCWSCGVKSIGGRTCPRCRLPGSPTYVWVSTIYDGVASELLKTFKFNHFRAASNDLAQIMQDTMLNLDTFEVIQSANYLAVPIPTASSRIRQRSFDHSQLLAEKIAAKLKIKCMPALGRLGQSRQVGSKREDRLTQAMGKYYVRLPSLVKQRRILLVDDVVTTGATLRAATKVLRDAGALRVDALVFAKRL